MNSIKTFLENQINLTLDEYRTRPERMISDFNREVELMSDYNGRQLYELLQNCDDAKAKSVLIEVDEDKKTFIIANDGNEPFDEKGFNSLLISNLTSKVKKTYIGNKGLGFRSIISWADCIIIESNNLRLKFSREIAAKNFENLFDQETRKKILDERNLSEDTKPFPFLSIPEIEENESENWTTKISINFESKPKVINDINSQISELHEEILLFLNNTNKIIIRNSENKILKRTKNGKIITINNVKWEIYEREDLFPSYLQDIQSKDKDEHYNLKIAISDKNINDVNFLYSYFPTKIDIPFPVIIHGTFDLNSSRNQLRKSSKNEFVLTKLAELLINTAKEITREEVSWKPLEILNYQSKNPVLDELNFYKKIDESILELAIFPCIDNKYRKLNDVIQVNDDFSEFIEEINKQSFFPNLLKSTKNSNIVLSKYHFPGSLEDSVSKINILSHKIETIQDRVKLISLVKKYFNSGDKYELLIDKNGTVISSTNDVYTPKTQGKADFYIPDFTHIDFLNKELFEQLVLEFSLSESNEKSRDLQRKIKEIVNLHSYEPAQVLIKIVSSTNKIIDSNPQNSASYIKEMVNSLFLNFLELSDSTKIPSDIRIPLLNTANKAVNSKELFISTDFPSGNLTNDLFGSVLTDEQFLAALKEYNLDKEDIQLVEDFFLWLGVNKFLRLETIDLSNSYEYESFVFKYIERPERCESTKIIVNNIVGSDLLKSMKKEEIVLWILKDEKLYKQIDRRNNSDSFKYKTWRERDYYNSLSNKPSYIIFLLSKADLLFDNYLLGDSNEWLNKYRFNYDYKLFKKYDISRKEITSILLKLGAEEEFFDLSIERVTEILKNLPEIKSDGKLTQSIYKRAVKHYQKNNLPLESSIVLFAQQGDVKGYFKQEEIYFSDNIRLPKKLRSKYPILNYPPRAAAKDAIEFFKINDLDSLEIKITSYSFVEKKTNEFNQLFEKLKQFILAFRLERIDDDQTKRNESSKLNKTKIHLCIAIQCKQKDEDFALDDYEFISEDLNNFYVKIRSDDTIKSLRINSWFADSFSEIIANTFGITGDKNEFRFMLRNDLDDTEHQIRNELGSDIIVEARELLGYSDYILSFWKAFYKSLDKNFETTHNRKDFLNNVKTDLGIVNIDIEIIDYENISNKKNLPILKNLFSNYELSINAFNDNAFYRIDLYDYHYDSLKNYFNKHEKIFKSNLWQYLSENPEKQNELLNLIQMFEHNEDYISKIAQDNYEIFDIDLEDIFSTFINSNFPFLKMDESKYFTDFDSIFEVSANSFSPDELEIIDSNPSIKSLLYFKNESNIEKVREHIQTVKDKESIQLQEQSNSFGGQLVESFSYTEKPFLQPDPSKLFLFNPRNERQKRKAGKIAEKIVYDKLSELYSATFVSWKSKEDDGLHYDIRYSPNEGNSWKYVEVKSFNNSIFYLSKPEHDFGIKNKENYEVWLVDSVNKIYPLRDFFVKNKYEINVKDYIVSIEIHELDVSTA